jgi:hypothetical protein
MDRTHNTNRTEQECVRDLEANSEKKRPVGRARYIWKDNIEIYI